MTTATSLARMIKAGRQAALVRGHAVDRFTHVNDRRAEAFCRRCADQVYVYAEPGASINGQAVVRQCSSVTEQEAAMYARLYA